MDYSSSSQHSSCAVYAGEIMQIIFVPGPEALAQCYLERWEPTQYKLCHKPWTVPNPPRPILLGVCKLWAKL